MNRFVFLFLGAVVVAAGIVAYSAVFTVHQTQQALVLQFGNPVRVVQEPGLHWKMPFIQDVTYYERRILDLDPPPLEVLLADQKRINVDSFARYRIVDPLEFRKKAFTDTNFKQIFGARLNAELRAEVAKVDLSDMLSGQRHAIMERIQDLLKVRGPEFGVELVDVRISRTDLPEATSQAVYNRMRSSRIAEAAKLRAEGEQLKAKIQAEADRDRTVLLAEAEKTAQTLRGEGEGTQTVILNRAYGQDYEFFDFYRSLQALGTALGDGTTMVLSPDSDFLRFFTGGSPGGAPVPGK
jgi:membrane protease subunit HflC